MNQRVSTKKNFITKDHKYVFLGCSVLIMFCLSLLNTQAPVPDSFIVQGNAVYACVCAVLWAFIAVSAVALIVKLTHWESYDRTFMKSDKAVAAARWFSYVAVICCALVLFDRVVLSLIYTVKMCLEMQSNPQEFFPSMIYMSAKGIDILKTGVWTTIRIALLGTAIAFLLSILLVFCRIQTPNKRDNDFVKLIKWIASHFARLYIFIIRGTPMMVQALIFYYFGFNLFKKTNMTVTEINHVWSFFISGLCTVSLNSTAYLTEVLRGGIDAIDVGQTEAARSVGMTNWQAMTKIVFPQAVKNSIPAIGNEFIINIKDSSVLSVIGVMDLMYATKSVSGIYFRSLEIYCVAALVYLLLTWLASLLLKFIGNKIGAQSKGIPSSN